MLGPITSLLFINVRHFYCVASISNRLFILDNINIYYWLLIIIITTLQYWRNFYQFRCILFRKALKDIRKDGVFTTIWNPGSRFVLNFFNEHLSIIQSAFLSIYALINMFMYTLFIFSTVEIVCLFELNVPNTYFKEFYNY